MFCECVCVCMCAWEQCVSVCCLCVCVCVGGCGWSLYACSLPLAKQRHFAPGLGDRANEVGEVSLLGQLAQRVNRTRPSCDGTDLMHSALPVSL